MSTQWRAQRLPRQTPTSEALEQPVSLDIRLVSSAQLDHLLPTLAELLRASVDGGASLGFLPPLTPDDARRYWRSLRPELEAGSRLLLAAWLGDRVIGSGQLTLPSWPNARHRAELQKLFVTSAMKGRGVGRTLLAALHETARHRGRSLILLNTRRGDPAEHFYKAHGYREVGVTPGYTIGAAGERFDNVTLYQQFPG